MNVKNKEVRIVDDKYAMSAASTQYTPRLMRERAIMLVPKGIKAFIIYEIGKVAKNTPMSVRIFLRCKFDPH